MLKPKRVRMIKSNTLDTCMNLAYEEYFMNTVDSDEWILFWWQSKNAVVIGRNQNPYQECNIEKMKADNVQLVRRLSGGGAVYHDTGNLNFSFISKGDLFNIENHFNLLIDALADLGIESEFTGRNDLSAKGRKFSGNAFIHDEDKHLHHGTLLIDSDVTKISNYLNVSHEKLDTKGFDSVKARVINLNTISPDITIDKIISSTQKSIEKKIGCRVVRNELSDINGDQVKVYLDKYYSDLWNYGDTPSFSCEMHQRFDWGTISISMDIDEGIIKQTAITTDALEVDAFTKLSSQLKETMLIPDHVYEQIKTIGLNRSMANDVYQLISNKIFS